MRGMVFDLAPWLHPISDSLQTSTLFNSTHQYRVLTVVCAIECGQQLPAIRRELRDVSVSDVPEYFRGIRGFSRLIGYRRGCNAKRNAKPFHAMGA